MQDNLIENKESQDNSQVNTSDRENTDNQDKCVVEKRRRCLRRTQTANNHGTKLLRIKLIYYIYYTNPYMYIRLTPAFFFQEILKKKLMNWSHVLIAKPWCGNQKV